MLPFPKIFAAVGLLSLFTPTAGKAIEVREEPGLAAAFKQAGVAGTFAVLDPHAAVLYVHDAGRAAKRFIPASTFKIANALIGLDCGAIANADEVLPYGGKPQPFPAWEHDMSVREGIKVSNVPVFQELARRIGIERMKAGVKKLGYGNGEIGTVADRFWLDGPLQISAMEEVEFLRKLAAGELPFSAESMATVREITEQEVSGDFKLHGKTGWATATVPNIGWYVGWVEQGGKSYPFALNIDMPDQEMAGKRIPLAKECLKILKLKKNE